MRCLKEKRFSLWLAAVALALLPGFRAGARAQAADDAGSFVNVNGAKIWYQVRGEGEPVILIPGGPGSSHLYLTPWFEELSARFKVIYFDAFGRGKSARAKKNSGYSLERDVSDLEGLRKKLGFKRWNVLGHSYGGIVAQAYALQFPKSVMRLILSNTLFDAEMWQENDDNCNHELRNQFPEKWEILIALRQKGHKSSSPEHIQAYDLPAGLLYFYDASNASKLRGESPPLSWDVYYRIVGEDADFVVGGDIEKLDFKKDLIRLRMPVLIIAGRYDRVAVPRFSVKYREYAPQAEFVMFEESGHYPFVEEQQKYFKTVSDFLKDTK